MNIIHFKLRFLTYLYKAISIPALHTDMSVSKATVSYSLAMEARIQFPVNIVLDVSWTTVD